MRNQSNAEVHCSRSDLIDHYYEIAEAPENIEHHLRDCATCAAMYQSITRDLDLVRDLYRREVMESVDAGFYERETRRLMQRIEQTAAKQRVLVWWRYAAVAASIILALTLGIYEHKDRSDLKQLRAQAEAVVGQLERSSGEQGAAMGFENEKTGPGFPTETEIRDSTDLLSEMD